MQQQGAGKFMAAVGMFDGVHRGHAFLLDTLKKEAHRHCLEPLALTFSRHPVSILHPESAPRLLTGINLRSELIRRNGVDNIGILSFDKACFCMTAAEFITRIRNEFGVEALLMGFNNHIGSDRCSGGMLADSGFRVTVAEPFPDIAVSSSAVREAIGNADFSKAESLLGHRFTVRGTVVHGRHLGRTIGFPTANISPDESSQLLPPDGVYAVNVRFRGTEARAMTNIGTRPTVGGHRRTIEVNIIGFDGDIYGETIDIDFLARLRDEKRFRSLDELAAQLAADRRAAIALIPENI